MINDLSVELNDIKNIYAAFTSVCVADISPSHACELMQLQFDLKPYLNDIENVNLFVNNFNEILPENLKFLRLKSHSNINENCKQTAEHFLF